MTAATNPPNTTATTTGALPETVRMFDPEAQHPWRWAAVYGAVVLASMLLAHAQARGWL